jgi:hypothetical protein
MAISICLLYALLFAAAAHAQVGEWAWVSGGNVSYNQNGVYGTLGVPAAANVPGDRDSSTTWTDVLAFAERLDLFSAREILSDLLARSGSIPGPRIPRILWWHLHGLE